MAQKAKWARNRDYERVAHKRMAAVTERFGIVTGGPPPQAYEREGLFALVAREPIGYLPEHSADAPALDMRWHISVNGAHIESGPRVPGWHELADAAHELRPGVVFVVGIPPRSHWMAAISSGEYVLHLWELRDERLATNWMNQRTPGGRRPS